MTTATLPVQHRRGRGHKIIDEFTDLPVSHQRKSQLRAVKNGKCGQCFRRQVHKAGSCRQCYDKKRAITAEWIRQNHSRQLSNIARWRERHPNYSAQWNAKHPDYHKNYYQKKKLTTPTRKAS